MAAGQLVDLAATRLGGMVIGASDEFFGPKESLLDPRPPVHDPDAYTDRGKLMDGWETRRRRSPGADWCVIRLGVPGVVRMLQVDTRFFRGNFPEGCWVEQAYAEPPEAPAEDDWTKLLPRTPLQGDTVAEFRVAGDDSPGIATHVRLWITPDGGVARFRVLGEVLTDLRAAATGQEGVLDLAALANGGFVESASGEFFSPRHNLIMVGDGRTMGDGWETRRRRDDGHDWVEVRLATPGMVDRLEIDTTHFKGNAPASCLVEARDGGDDGSWFELLPRHRLAPHFRHGFRVDPHRTAARLRLRIFPDGGVSRLRAFGRPTDAGWEHATLRWLNAVPAPRAVRSLLTCCASPRWAGQVVTTRPWASLAELRTVTERLWWELEPRDWEQAFAAHPRIGDRSGPVHTRREQAGTASAPADVLEALVEGNRAYEERFDRVFLISASGRSAEEMLTALRQRLAADPADELRTAAGEQAQITDVRLRRLMHPAGADVER